MSRRLFASLISVILPVAAAGQAPVVLDVMSFNIRYGTANDGENSWEHRHELVARMVQSLAPDIVGMQECLDFQADYLAKTLPQYRWLGIGREEDCSGESCAVLYNHERLAPIQTGTFWLSESPETPGSRSWETACTRIVTWVRFYAKNERCFFYLFNTHFDHRSEEARQGAARLLLERIPGIAGNAPVVVTADFNAAAETSEPWCILAEGGLSDAWLTAGSTQGPPVTWGAFGPPADGSNRIDWILTRGPVRVEQCTTVLYNEDGRYPSDHYPVIARLQITP